MDDESRNAQILERLCAIGCAKDRGDLTQRA
jgi:hypothetical protein